MSYASGPAAAEWISRQPDPSQFRTLDEGEHMANKKPKEEQPALIDTDHPEDKALIKAAKKYREVRDERMGLTEEEVKAHDAVVTIMEDRGLEVYKHDGISIRLAKGKTKAKVRTVDDEDEDQGEESPE